MCTCTMLRRERDEPRRHGPALPDAPMGRSPGAAGLLYVFSRRPGTWKRGSGLFVSPV